MINRVSHIIVYVKDMQRMVSFWQSKIGLKPSYVSDMWSEIPLENITLALHYSEDPEPRNTGIVFTVNDIYAVVKELRAKGVNVGEIKDIGIGLETFFTDPEGNTYEIFQPHKA